MVSDWFDQILVMQLNLYPILHMLAVSKMVYSIISAGDFRQNNSWSSMSEGKYNLYTIPIGYLVSIANFFFIFLSSHRIALAFTYTIHWFFFMGIYFCKWRDPHSSCFIESCDILYPDTFGTIQICCKI